MFEEQAAAARVQHQVPGAMTYKRALFGAAAIAAAFGAVYALLAMLTQGMLGGASPAEVWWDRVYAWWIGFLSAGLLVMLSVFLWNKARSHEASLWSGHHAGRVLLFPLGQVFLTGALYCADFAYYLFNQGRSGMLYAAFAAPAAAVAVAIFWRARKLKAVVR